MVNGLIRHGGLKPHEIAFFTQRDAFGDAGFAGGMQALRRYGLQDESLITHVRYERNTNAVENGLATILLADPQPKAIIMVAAYGPCSRFVRLAKTHGIKSRLLAVSFVGAAQLAEELGAAGEGVIVTEVIPHDLEKFPIIREFRHALKDSPLAESASFAALEGYIVARILIKALNKLEGEVSREKIIDALEALGQFDFGVGFPLHLSRMEHQASHHVWPTIINNGEVMPFKWQDLIN
jgi:ABC-type branched-subunit amino acid transport system substrate-binding protein